MKGPTMRVRLQLLPIFTLAALLTLLSACGGGSSSSKTPTAAATGSQPAGATQPPSAATGATQGKTKPCDLLTLDELQSATGKTVAAGKPKGGAECQWAVGPTDEGNTVDVELFTADFYKGLAPSASVKVPGIGDEALWASGLETLYVKTGTRAFAVQVVLTADDTTLQTIAKSFALKVLERM